MPISGNQGQSGSIQASQDQLGPIRPNIGELGLIGSSQFTFKSIEANLSRSEIFEVNPYQSGLTGAK